MYLDPPFQSGKDYNVIFASHEGERGGERAQAEAFMDTWKWGRESEELYAEMKHAGGSKRGDTAASVHLTGRSA